MDMRINKYIAICGIGSRRHSETYIREARIKVNGKTITDLSTKIHPEKDEVTLDDRIIVPVNNRIYLALNKPTGYITSKTDPFNRKVVMDLINLDYKTVFPIGRLDYNSEGLLLFTNDGELAYRLTHPKYEIQKHYLVLIKGKLNHDQIKQFREGIMLTEGITSPAQLKWISEQNHKNLYKVVIHQGWNRQIRRMFNYLGYNVVELKRIQFGPVSLGSLKSGEYRQLTEKEVQALYKLTDMENH